MTRLTLSFIAPENERTKPLLDGVVQPEGIELVCTRSRAYSHEQGLIPEKPNVEDLFAPSTIDL